MSAPIAPDAAALARRLEAAGWTVALTPGTGTVDRTTKGPPRGDGTRPKVVVQVPCISVAVRAQHPDGRALRALWISSTTTKKGAPSWSMDQAWRGRQGDELVPVQLTTATLAEYLTEPEPAPVLPLRAEVYGLDADDHEEIAA